MTRLPTLAVVALLAACTSTGQLTPQAQQALQIGCKIDQSFQPIAATTLATLLPQSTPLVAADNVLVHPNVVKFCDSLGGTPAAATVSVATPAPAASTPAPAPAAKP